MIAKTMRSFAPANTLLAWHDKYLEASASQQLWLCKPRPHESGHSCQSYVEPAVTQRKTLLRHTLRMRKWKARTSGRQPLTCHSCRVQHKLMHSLA